MADEEGKREIKLSLAQHIGELSRRVILSFAVFAIFFFLIFTFKPVTFKIWGLELFYPSPDPFNSFATIIFGIFRRQLLPSQMRLLNINPMDTLAAAIYISLVSAFILSLPFWSYELTEFVAPALTVKEKKMLRNVIVPSALLFLVGAFFAYKVILPVIFHLIYFFAVGFDVEPTVSVRTFISTIIIYVILLGAAFELPVVMACLSYLGIVSHKTWADNWRIIVLTSFFVGLLLSPGTGSGIIEITIGLMLSALYFVGLIATKRFRKKSEF